jgi:hypothetical protein
LVLQERATELDQPETEGVELHARHAELDKPVPERVQQPVGGGMKQEPELVGHKGMVAQAITMAGALEVLDPVLGRSAPLDVPVVEVERGIAAVGHDKAGIGALGVRLRLVDQTRFFSPGACLISRLPRQPHQAASAKQAIPPRACCLYCQGMGQPEITPRLPTDVQAGNQLRANAGASML